MKVTRIENTASYNGPVFDRCKKLTSITIPASVTSIRERFFDFCDNLANISVDENNANYSSAGGILFDKGKTAILACPSTLSSVNIPDSVTRIGSYAFKECKNLTQIIIPNGVVSIGEYAFMDCRSLASVTLPDGLVSIGGWAFASCSFDSMTIHDTEYPSLIR